MDSNQPWHRLPKEPPKAFAAAQEYFSLGADRSIAKCTIGHPRQRETWSARWHWVKRAAALDAAQAELQEAENKRAIKERAEELAARQLAQREENWRLAEALRARATLMLQWPLSQTTEELEGEDTLVGEGGIRQVVKKKVVIKPVRWTQRDAARFAEVASKIGALSTDTPTDHIAHSGAQVTIYLPDNGRDDRQD